MHDGGCMWRKFLNDGCNHGSQVDSNNGTIIVGHVKDDSIGEHDVDGGICKGRWWRWFLNDSSE